MTNVLNFFLKIMELWKGYFWVKVGIALVVTGAGLFGGNLLNYSFRYEYGNFSVVSEAPSLLQSMAGFLLITVGLFFIFSQYIKQSKEPPKFVYLRGIQNMSNLTPLYAMSPLDKAFGAEPIAPPFCDSYIKENVVAEYNHFRRTFGDHTLTSSTKKIYIAALGSFPFLFLSGTYFRNSNKETIILDSDRNNDNRWHRLHQFDTRETTLISQSNISIDVPAAVNNLIDRLKSTDITNRDVGIALSFTFQIRQEDIPEELRVKTLFLTLNDGCGHNKLDSEEAQNKIVGKLSGIFNTFSKDFDRIHLFVASQASFQIRLGRNYMDNSHGTLTLHNYNNDIRGYDWSVNFKRGEIV